MTRIRRLLSTLGPGLIAGAADDDPAGIITDLQAGARFQFALAWTAIVQLPLLYAIQSMAARIGLITGRNVARVIADHYPRPVLWAACALLLVANTFTAGADLAGVGASLTLARVPYALAVVVAATTLVVVLVFAGYRSIANTLKWLTISLFAYVAAGLLAKPQLTKLLMATAIPHVQMTRDFMALLIGVFGGTISPYMLVWQSAEEVEDLGEAHKRPLRERPKSSARELRKMRTDTWLGMGVSQLIEYFAFIAGGAVLFPMGIREITGARQAATSLQPIGHGFGQILFAVGMIGSGLIAVPTLTGASAYAIASTVGWRASIRSRPGEARGFYAVFVGGIVAAMCIALFAHQPMGLLVPSQILNGIVAVPLLITLLVIANSQKILGAHTNGWALNVAGLVTVLIMLVPSVLLLFLH